MKKKGLNQVDWAISLGIFLVYIAWFFIFMKPQITTSADLAPLERIVHDNLINEITWEANKQPIFIRSNSNKNDKVIFYDYTPEYGDSNFTLLTSDYYYKNNKMMILNNFLNKTKDYNIIVSSNKNYSNTNNELDIISNGNTTTTSKGLIAIFSKGLLRDLDYKTNNPLKKVKYFINGNNFPLSNNLITDSNILLEHRAVSQPLTINTRVIAKNSILWFNIEKNDVGSNSTLLIDFESDSYINYFSDNGNYGNFSDDSCKNYNHDYLKFYDAKDSISFLLPKNTLINFCNNQTDIKINFSILTDSDKDFFIILDNKNYTQSDFYNYSTDLGIKDTLEGIDSDLLTNYNYSIKKKIWGFPEDRDFHVVIWNSSKNRIDKRTNILFEIGSYPFTNSEVFAKEYSKFLLDKNGNFNEVTLSVKTW